MRLRLARYGLKIYPETWRKDDEIDEAYIEEVLGLKRDGDYIRLVRKNAVGLSCIAYLETEKEDHPEEIMDDINTREKFEEYLEEFWNMDIRAYGVEGGYLIISTGGWSDNKYGIQKLRCTRFWLERLAWEQPGGHYYFWLGDLHADGRRYIPDPSDKEEIKRLEKENEELRSAMEELSKSHDENVSDLEKELDEYKMKED